MLKIDFIPAQASHCECGKDAVVTVRTTTEDGSEDFGPFCSDCLVSARSPLQLTSSIKPIDVGPIGRKPPSKRIKKCSLAQEHQIAEDIGGRTQPGSGNQHWAKSDVRLKGIYRVEAKFTQNKEYKLALSDLQKIAGECQGLEKPAFVISFRDRSLRVLDDFVVIPYEEIHDLAKLATEKQAFMHRRPAG